MMCPRCGADVLDGELRHRGAWCAECERAYDVWARRNAADIIWVVLSGGVVLTGIGIVLPLFGIDWMVAAVAALCGWSTIYSVHRLNVRRRRREFLGPSALPRAYLPAPK